MVADRPVTFLLGRRDEPTDGVEDYSIHLGRALEERGVPFSLHRIPWSTVGWVRALLWVLRQAHQWKHTWVLVQYTALAWSKQGFPVAFPLVVLTLRLRGCRCAVVFHDPSGFPGTRFRDGARRAAQMASMKAASFLAHRSIVTIPLDRLSWRPARAAFVPVGANLPLIEAGRPARDGVLTVVVYGVTGGERTNKEVEDIAFAVDRAVARLAAEGKRVRLRVLGRGAIEAEPLLRVTAPNVELDLHGVLPAPKVAGLLATSTVQLFVRGGISSRRGSAIAGIACRLPVVGFSGPETASPVTDAGVVLVDEGDRESVADSLARVLQDETLRQDLSARSQRAYELWFSWDAIAGRILSVLNNNPDG